MTSGFEQQVFSFLGEVVVAGGGGGVVAYGIFRLLGKNWIEHQLAKDLEAAKAEIGLTAARRLKLHDREYTVFPGVWERLNTAFRSLGVAIVSFREIPDFSRMQQPEIDTWLSRRKDFTDEETDYFKKQKDKVQALSRILDTRSLSTAHSDFIAFRDFFQANSIFISPDIKAKLDEISSLMNEAWAARRMDLDGHRLEDNKSFLTQAWKTYQEKVKPLMSEIEGSVQSRLFPGQKQS
jgi:hypothetical protein